MNPALKTGSPRVPFWNKTCKKPKTHSKQTQQPATGRFWSKSFLFQRRPLVQTMLHLHPGVVFPYQHPRGRYQLSFQGARQACEGQDATVATFAQLHQSWKEGMNWCNAGWLADGTVQYPITQPRVSCGGVSRGPGVRNYGSRHRHLHRYDVFCFSSSLRGEDSISPLLPITGYTIYLLSNLILNVRAWSYFFFCSLTQCFPISALKSNCGCYHNSFPFYFLLLFLYDLESLNWMQHVVSPAI